jgi:hypothetical protein
MSWVFLPEPGADCSHRDCWVGAPSEPSRSIPIASACSPRDSATEPSSPSLSGMTSEPLTAVPGAIASTSSVGAFPARTSAVQDRGAVCPEIAQGFGLRCCALLAKFGLRMSSPKTLRIYAPGGWMSSSKGLPTWGLMQHGVCWELGTLAPPTSENVCGSLLPTPTGAGNEGSPSMQKWPAHRALARLMPTPIASDRNGDRPRGAGSLARGGGQRLTRVPGGGFIALREWMMGWPIGWSALEPLATDKFRQWLSSHGKS